MTDDTPAEELADRLEDAEATLDVVTDVVDRLRDPESSEGVHLPPDVAERLERVETRIDTLSALVLKLTSDEVSGSETSPGDDTVGEDEDVSDGDSDAGRGTSRGYY